VSCFIANRLIKVAIRGIRRIKAISLLEAKTLNKNFAFKISLFLLFQKSSINYIVSISELASNI